MVYHSHSQIWQIIKLLSDIQTLCLQISSIKYDANQEIGNTYENLQIVRSQLCTKKLIVIFIQSYSNIYFGLSVF
jgi:hypothetical protein